MWDVSHADDDSVLCYNDEYHCFLQTEIHSIRQHIIHQFKHKKISSVQVNLL